MFGTNLQGEEVLGIQTVADIADLPDGAIDLVFVCTPAAANPDLLRACAAQGHPGRVPDLAPATARRATTGGVAEDELVALADELGILLAGPNGQGVVSTPAHAVRPDRRPVSAGRAIGVASQSGNFVSTLPQLRPADRRRASAGRCRPATPPP